MTECRQGEHRDGRIAATVRVRYVENGRESWTTDMCDRHGTLTYERFIREGRTGVEIMPAGWTPEHPIRKQLREITEPELHPINLDPYPGTVDEVADEIARFVLELEDAGIANGLAAKVRERLLLGRCGTCKGLGHVGYEPCTDCFATGEVPYGSTPEGFEQSRQEWLRKYGERDQ